MRSLILILAFASILGGCAASTSTSGRVVIQDDSAMVDIRFSDRDRALIDSYYRKPAKGKKGMPPGLAKRGGNLPPGLAKRDTLPPGLSGEPLPHELERDLAPLPGNYVRVRVGGDIVLMDGKTRVVFDILYGIAR